MIMRWPATALEPVTDPRSLAFARHPRSRNSSNGSSNRNLLKRAFREVAVIGGLVERAHPGKRKSGRQVTFSTDLIYDVLRRYEPEHLLLTAAWVDARARMTELGRLVRLVDRAAATMVHVDLDRISPMAVPLMVIVGRESARRLGRRSDIARSRGARRRSDADRLNLPSSWPSRAKLAPMIPRVFFLAAPAPPRRLRRRHRRQTAVDVVKLPVKVVSAGVDAATTSQSEADEKRGRELRKAEEKAGARSARSRGARQESCIRAAKRVAPCTRALFSRHRI